MSVSDVIGVVGVLLYLATYFLLQIEKLRFDDYSYLALNALAAVLIGISLVEEFNLPAFMIEVAWASISLLGIVRRLQSDASRQCEESQRAWTAPEGSKSGFGNHSHSGLEPPSPGIHTIN